MSVLVEAISVVVATAVLEKKYPGGAAQYERDCPNVTFCADEHLTRIGFMVPGDVGAFVVRLSRLGLVFQRDGRSADIVVVDQLHGPTTLCDWLESGRHPDGYSAAWLAGTEPGALAHPPGWTPAQSAAMNFVSNESARDRLQVLANEENLETVLDYETGKQVFRGRVR
jgi:hypothetical protein